MSAVSLDYRATPANPVEGVALLVEREGGGQRALLVDAIQGQRQVVIKSLEANYRRCRASPPPPSWATAAWRSSSTSTPSSRLRAARPCSSKHALAAAWVRSMTVCSRKTMSHGGRELISFRIGDQEFCVDIMAVREIRGWTPATALPHSPAYVQGVINLRGAVLPIVDLAARLGLKPAEPTVRHVIIVAQVGEQVVGLLVDAVSDILTVTDDRDPADAGRRLRDRAVLRPRPARDRRPHDQPDRPGSDVARHWKAKPHEHAGRHRSARQSPDECPGDGEFPFTAATFAEIAAMIHADAGIHLPEQGDAGLFAPGQAPARAGPGELPRILRSWSRRRRASPSGSEMLGALTTNVTRFFREPHHFDHLKPTCCRSFWRRAKNGGRVRIWSAACSGGQEPYSIALTILSLMPDAADYDIRDPGHRHRPEDPREGAGPGPMTRQRSKPSARPMRKQWFAKPTSTAA